MPLEPPSVEGTYPTLDHAFRALQRHARSQGYALVKVRPCNYDTNGVARRYDIACACGDRKRASSSTGARKSRTRKTGCPFRMKVTQKRLLGNVWVPEVMCGEHNHPPEDPAKFPEHRLGALRRRHFEKIKALSEEGKNCRAIREAMQADEPNLLLKDADIGNILRDLKAREGEGESDEQNASTRRRRPRRILNSDDEEEDLLDRQEVEAQATAQAAAEQESELHKTLLALIPTIVQETIAAMPSAPPPQVAAIAAATTARLRDIARQHQHPSPHHYQHPHPQPQQRQQLQLPAMHHPDVVHAQEASTLRSAAPTSAGPPQHLGFGLLIPPHSSRF